MKLRVVQRQQLYVHACCCCGFLVGLPACCTTQAPAPQSPGLRPCARQACLLPCHRCSSAAANAQRGLPAAGRWSGACACAKRSARRPPVCVAPARQGRKRLPRTKPHVHATAREPAGRGGRDGSPPPCLAHPQSPEAQLVLAGGVVGGAAGGCIGHGRHVQLLGRAARQRSGKARCLGHMHDSLCLLLPAV